MDPLLQFVLELGKNYGPVGVLAGIGTAYIYWDKVINPRRKKKSGDWVSWASIKEDLTKMEKAIELLKTTIHAHDIDDTKRFTMMEDITKNVSKMLEILQGRIHSYIDTSRSDFQEMRKEIRDDIRGVHTRIDQIIVKQK